MTSCKAPWVRLILITGAFLFFMPSPQAAQYNYNSNCQQAYQAILSLRFAEAQNLVAVEKKLEPDNLVPVYLENLIDFLTLTIGEERQDYDRLKENKSARVKALERGRDDSPYHNFCLGEVHLQWALARIKFGDYATAAFEFHKAYDLFLENEAKHPSFLINKIGMGVIHVMVSLVPEKYKWVSNLAGLDGSMELGMNEIRQVAEYSGSDKITRMYKTQATFFLAFLSLNLQKNRQDALSFLGVLQDHSAANRQIRSPLMIYARATILMKNGFNDDALNVLQERSSLSGTYHFYYLDYLEGMARLNKLDFSASNYFEHYIAGFKGQNYIRAAFQKLAWISLMKGDSARYSYLINQGSVNSSGVDEDKQAAFEAENKTMPNILLLRARLLSDGGYYGMALNELLNNSVWTIARSKSNLLEYTYRLGRIYHEQGNFQKAIENYRQTFKRGRKEPWYFAAGAAYQMGLLYENKGAYAEADTAYHQCLSCNPREYKTSLHQKAKAGLDRLKKLQPKI